MQAISLLKELKNKSIHLPLNKFERALFFDVIPEFTTNLGVISFNSDQSKYRRAF